MSTDERQSIKLHHIHEERFIPKVNETSEKLEGSSQTLMYTQFMFRYCSPCCELSDWAFRSVFWVDHEQHMWEASAKIWTVSVMMSGRFRYICILAFRTIQFYHSFTGHIRQTYTKNMRWNSTSYRLGTTYGKYIIKYFNEQSQQHSLFFWNPLK